MPKGDTTYWAVVLALGAAAVPFLIGVTRFAFSVANVRISYRIQRIMDGYFYIGTWIGFFLFLAYPLGWSLYISFHNVKITSSELQFTFLVWKNYAEPFLEDVNYLPLFTKTLANLISDLPIILLFSLFVAILVVQELPGRGVFRMLLFMPVVIGSAIVIRRLFGEGVSTEAIGVNVQTLSGVVFTYLRGALADWVLDLVNRIWRTGVQILIFVAGLHAVPVTMREAAKVDGASNWQIFWRITLPLLSPVILVNVVYTIVDSFTDPFNDVLTYIQTVGLTRDFRLGYAAALGWMYFVVVFVILGIALAITSRFVFYAGERR